jgi:hypothetical protein
VETELARLAILNAGRSQRPEASEISQPCSETHRAWPPLGQAVLLGAKEQSEMDNLAKAAKEAMKKWKHPPLNLRASPKRKRHFKARPKAQRLKEIQKMLKKGKAHLQYSLNPKKNLVRTKVTKKFQGGLPELGRR